MKKTPTLCYILLGALLSLSSCDLFRLDNYDEPAETLQGEVVDVATGERVLTDQGGEGVRIRLTELSWTGVETPTHNPDFYCMPDGTFQHTKLFKGSYNIRIDGPFIPLLREDSNGTLIADETKTMEISGVTQVRFEVQPFLKVEWVDLPTVSNGKITAKVKVTRAVSETDFRAKIEPMGGWDNSFSNITDIQLFVSGSSSVGYRTRDTRWTGQLEYTGNSFDALLGQTVTIQSIGAIPSGRTVFIRAAARINYATETHRRYNYTEPLEVLVP
ncbi:MAG: DUF3823 domain-containing protein [Prevotellaceae bacterium]|jgi:hypothetical protein|nr:DUF3823 domain-containing protein [Prevotellaceae bacterium]